MDGGKIKTDTSKAYYSIFYPHSFRMGGDSIRDNHMLNQNIGSLVLKLSFPPMAGMVIYSIFSLLDTFFIAKLGSASLAALTVCIPVLILLTSVASATGVGVTSLLSRTLGTGDIRAADNIAWHGLIIGIFYGLIFVLLGLKFIDSILMLFGCTPETFVLSKQYLHIVLIGSLFMFIPMMLEDILEGEGNTFFPMVVSLIGMALNVALDPLLIFGLGSIKGLGIKGAALASVLARVISSIIIIAYTFKKRTFLTWALANFRPNLKIILDIYRVGLPAMVMDIAGVAIIGFLNRILAGYSCTAVATLGVFLRIRSFIYMPVCGLAQGVMPIIGFAYGVGNFDRVKEAIIKVSVLACLIMGCGWIVLQYYPLWIMNFFSAEPTLTLLGVTCLQMATIFLPLMGPIMILYTALQALGKGLTAMWLSLIRQIIFFLPLLIILPQYLGLRGVWLAFSVSEFLSIILAGYFLVRLWRQLQTNHRVPVLIFLKVGYVFRRIIAWLKW